MQLHINLLQRAYQHFSYDPKRSAQNPFYSIPIGNPSQFFLNRKGLDSYDQYTLNSSLLFSVIEYTPEHTTSLFVDPHLQFFVSDQTGPEYVSRLHKHNYFELVYVADGNLDLLIEGRQYRLSHGDACIINSNVRHVESRTTPYTAIYLGISPSFLKDFLPAKAHESQPPGLDQFLRRNREQNDQIDYLNFQCLDPFEGSTSQQHFEQHFYQMFGELLMQETGYVEMCGIYTQRLFSTLQNPACYLCSNVRFQFQNRHTVFEQTLDYINHVKRKVTRQELEQALNYNGNYISRVFQKQTQQSLAEYIREVCLTEASVLLLNTSLTILEIAHQVGYENKTVFYDLFKKKFGMTPQQYRNRTSKSN